MIDEADAAEERMEFDTEVSVKNVCEKAKKFDPGSPGECSLCGEVLHRVIEVQHNDKLVMACGRCRDRHRIA